MSGLDLSGQNLTDVNFEGTFAGAKFDDAVISGGKFDRARELTADQIRATWNFKHGRMADIELPAAVARLDPARSVAYACPGDKPGRRAGASPPTIERIHREGGFAATYVKADGARMRMVKAPGADEPALPESATTVLPRFLVGSALRRFASDTDCGWAAARPRLL